MSVTAALKREDGSSAPFGNQTLDPEFPLYHGVIDCQTAMDRLGTVSSPGAFLVRNTGWDHVITYLDQTLDIKHIMIGFGKNTFLRQHNPHIKNLQTAVEVMVSLDPKRFAHEVHWTKFDNFKLQRYKSDLKNMCHVCEKDYHNHKAIISHYVNHKVSYCKSCLGLIATKYINQHRIVCEKRPKEYKCHICDFGTRWRSRLKEHMDKFHGKKTIQCKYCQKCFSRSDLLEKHLKIHEGYECSFCGKRFNSRQGRQYHLKANHVEKDKEIETFIQNNRFSVENIVMDSEFKMKDPLIQLNAHDSSNISPSDEAKEHKPSSSNKKCFQCKFCDYQGNSKVWVKRHVEKIHLSVRTPVVLKCEFCADFSTAYKKALLYHQQNSCPSLSEDSHVVWFDA